MDSQQPLINIPNNTNYPQSNQLQNPKIVNPTPYYPNNNYYQQSNQNNPPQNNPLPQEILQYPNSSDFPNYNPVINEKSNTQIDYSKYTNINQLNYRGIKQSNNSFYVTKRCCEKLFPIIYFTFSLGFAGLVFYTEVNVITVLTSIVGFIFAGCGILMLCRSYHSVTFVLEPKSIKVTESAWCGRKTTVFGSGQITQILFNSEYKIMNGKPFHSYKITIFQNIPGEVPENNIFGSGYKNVLYTEEEMGYFNYVMNHHIQTNMNIQIMN